jgi:hypothetical protein
MMAKWRPGMSLVKPCIVCGEQKPYSEYYGPANTCKACAILRAKRRRLANSRAQADAPASQAACKQVACAGSLERGLSDRQIREHAERCSDAPVMAPAMTSTNAPERSLSDPERPARPRLYGAVDRRIYGEQHFRKPATS